MFAAWSLRVEPDPGPLAAAALALGRSAQLPAWRARPRPTSMPSTRGTVLLLAAAAGPAGGALGWVVLLRQLANLAKALHDVHQAAGELQRAREIEQMVRSQLAQVAGGLKEAHQGPQPEVDREALRAAQAAGQGQIPAQRPGPPVGEQPPQRPAGSGRPRGVREPGPER